MRPDPDDGDAPDAGEDLREAFMTAFCSLLHESRMPPMAVMELAAQAVGSIYREVADAHREGACPCGWLPDPAADLEALQAALTLAAGPAPVFDLRKAQVAGQA